jgi:rhodanese-related sulfurtransferase
VFGFFHRKPDPSEVTPEDVQQRQAAGERLFILDVREHAEYAEAHIAGSRLIPLSQLANHIVSLPQDQTIVAVCRSGNRSGAAMGMLKRAGFAKVVNLKGGMIAWTRSGLPVEHGK